MFGGAIFYGSARYKNQSVYPQSETKCRKNDNRKLKVIF